MKYIRSHKTKRTKSHIPFRLNLLFFVAFVLLAALVGQLAYLQIVNGANFSNLVSMTDETTVTGAVPRGLVYDSKGRALVTNKANNAVTYTKSIGTTSVQMRKTADQLAKYLTIDPEKLTKRDKADYYLATKANAEAVLKALPKAQQKEPDASKLYKLQVKYAEKHLPAFTAENLQAAAIYKIMNGATQLTTVYIKNANVTEEETAAVGEHLSSMAGVNLGTDWERHYPNGDSMTSIIGTVSSTKAGLPADNLKAYLANGYARNDRVGISYLEKAYENVLTGAKSRTQVEIGNNNEITSQVQTFKGQQGANLNLTIDSAYQTKVDAILKSTFQSALSSGAANYSDGAYAVAMNPKTGAILALSGVAHKNGAKTTTDDALGVLNRAFAMGSSVKPAMMLGALQDGVISVDNNTLPDDPIYLPGTPVKKSLYPAGTFKSMNAPLALEVSSNIYMMQLAMKEGHGKYEPYRSLTMDDDIFTKMRGYFGQFGLGQTTGVDLPGETKGQQGPTMLNGALAVGSALDLSFGNYDTYSLMQMVQYASTVANDGYRMRPYIVNSISQTLSDGSSGPTLTTTQPQVQLKVKNTQAQLDLVKQGMWQVVHGTNAWTTGTRLSDLNPGVAGKTGTAQTFTRAVTNDNNSALIETTTLSFVGFAPAKDPQIAIAVVVPNLTSTSGAYNTVIARQMFADYYALNKVEPAKDYSTTQAKLN